MRYQQVGLARREVESKNELLTTYERMASTPNTNNDGDAVAQRDARIVHCEALLREKQQEIDALRKDAMETVAVHVHQAVQARCKELEGTAAEGETEAAKVRRQLEKIEAELASYESAAARGEFNSSTTKVLHMVQNPSAAAARQKLMDSAGVREENDRLREEVEALRDQLRALQEASNSSASDAAAAASDAADAAGASDSASASASASGVGSGANLSSSGLGASSSGSGGSKLTASVVSY